MNIDHHAGDGQQPLAHNGTSPKPAPTRRAVLAGIAGAGLTVPALAALPAVAADAALLRVVREFDAAKAAWEIADTRKGNLCALAHQEYPEPPRSICHHIKRVDGSDGLSPLSRNDIAATRWARGNEENERIKQERLAAREAYDAPCRAINERYGVPEAQARATAALTEYIKAEERVYHASENTAEGIAVKLRVVVRKHEDFEIPPSLLGSIADDAERIGRPA